MRKSLAIFLIVFVLGMFAGLGAGMVIGKNNANAALTNANRELQTRMDTVNENYMLLMREYNKLFSLRASAFSSSVVQVVPASESGTVIIPEVQAPLAPTEAVTETAPTPAPADASTNAQVESGKPVANFEAASLGGTGPLEGPPPQPFLFTDLSTGNITSWEWDFGDGVKSTEQNPEHTIEKCPGKDELCTVTLTVCGPDGCETMTKIDYLWVSESCTGC